MRPKKQGHAISSENAKHIPKYVSGLSTYFGVSIKGEAAGVALFQHINDGTTTNDMVISLAKPVDGRYVTITLPGNNRQLIICEMEVFGGSLCNVQSI